VAQDTLHSRSLRAITVTDNRFKKQDDIIDIKRTAMPTLVIDQQTIRAMGSRRLDEVLREQTGMAMVNDLGSGNRSVGLQMQGFSSDYIMVLIDGQPMTGRFNGNFDLSRISVANIARIEIIKGASSSLYGSEALGGVINIITHQNNTAPQAMLQLLYGSYNMVDVTAGGSTPFAQQRGNVQVSGNYYRTDGFNVNTTYLKNGQTAPPYNSYNLQGRASYRLNDISTLLLSSRYANRQSVMMRSYGVQPFRDQLDEQDMNTAVSLDNRYKSGWRLLGRYYFTHYKTAQAVQLVETGKELQRNDFTQNIHRAELQAAKDYLNNKLSLIGGGGGDYQHLNNSAIRGNTSMYNYFGYVQASYNPTDKYGFILGARYDGNNTYGGKLNPSAGAHYKPAKWLTLKAAMGKGFKSPTYAQLYQVFTNITQGYTVVGANNFQEQVTALQKAGLVQQVWDNAANIQSLQPETSTSYNLGAQFAFAKTLTFNVNGFYNQINNLINTEQVGVMRNGQQLFSYLNIHRIFTRGLEMELKCQPFKGFTFSAGYQLLTAKSQDIIDTIKAGHSTVRAAGGIRTAATSDYFGLPNRSRHMGSAMLLYHYQPWGVSTTLRASYRGKYGFLDIDNNGYIDQYDVFVKGYMLLNVAVQKTLLKEKLTLQLALDNITNYTDYLMPSQPGRVISGGLMWQLRKF